MGRLAKTIGTLGISLLTAMPMMAINDSEAGCIEERLAAASTLEVEAPNSTRQINHLATHSGEINIATTLLEGQGRPETQLEGTVMDAVYVFDRSDLDLQYDQVEVKANSFASDQSGLSREDYMTVGDSAGTLYSNSDFTAGTATNDADLAKDCTGQLTEGQRHLGKTFPAIFRVRDSKDFKGFIAPTASESVYEWNAVNSDYSGTLEASVNSEGDVSGNMSLSMNGSGSGEACLVNPVSGLESCVSTGGEMSVAASQIVGGTVYANVDGGGIAECPVGYATDSKFPDYCFDVKITPQGGQTIDASKEASCVPDSMCFSGALEGRPELFVRMLGCVDGNCVGRPNGYIWPTLIRFTPSAVDVSIIQKSTGEEKEYTLEAVPKGTVTDLSGLQDREGFTP